MHECDLSITGVDPVGPNSLTTQVFRSQNLISYFPAMRASTSETQKNDPNSLYGSNNCNGTVFIEGWSLDTGGL